MSQLAHSVDLLRKILKMLSHRTRSTSTFSIMMRASLLFAIY